MKQRLISLSAMMELHPQGLLIGPFQRHYQWGQERQGAPGSAQYLAECLVEAFRTGSDYFLQGITVDGDSLIDGQQRLTCICLLLRLLGYEGSFNIRYQGRPQAQAFMDDPLHAPVPAASQDAYFMRHTIEVCARILAEASVEHGAFLRFMLDHLMFLHISLPKGSDPVAIYTMMNGTKAPMLSADVIKAQILHLAADETQPHTSPWHLDALRSRYTQQWDRWVRWWNTPAVASYFELDPKHHALELLLRLTLREKTQDHGRPFTYTEFLECIARRDSEPYQAAKHIFAELRMVQKRFEQTYADSVTYNKIRAIILLQQPGQRHTFYHDYFVEATISPEELDRYYRLSFLGMTIDEIRRRESAAERFDDLLASLSQADVYHSEAKRDVFNLLLRLNIDEDNKLHRKFDFEVWRNRSLEHIYSKSKVWHTDEAGHILDGNDNVLRQTRAQISADKTYLHRDEIVNIDGTPLSEHCIGNIVLIYGQNNATFGNATFAQKKVMFLTPGDLTVFRSRNLLHSVCVFASPHWDARSIIENYNLTLKNLKIYYGFK